MNASWNLYSFDQQKLTELFGHAPGPIADALVEILTDEDYFDFDDKEVAEAVARRVTSEGYSYCNSNEDERDVLDCLPIAMLKGSGPVARFLEAAPESPNGIHVNVAGELLKRAKGLDLNLLPLFDKGRRFGEASCEYCEYILFSPDEVGQLLAEVGQVIALDRRWSHADFPPVVEKEVLAPLRKIAQAGRGVAAFFS
jgi:hypothetical protein